MYSKYMIICVKPLHNKEQTGKGMYDIIEKYHTDLDRIYTRKGIRLVPLSRLLLTEIFNKVRDIPYRRDIKPIEVVARPKHIWKHKKMGMDCKKKALMIASWLKRNNYPYRLVSSSRKRNRKIHHVFPQAFLGNGWRNVDATYSHYKIFDPKKVTKVQVL